MNTGCHPKLYNSGKLERSIFQFSLFNLLLAAIVGVFLRSIPVTDFAVPWYKNILHAHSHFALGGWVMPALLVLLMRYYPELVNKINYKHWRNIAVLLLFSAYGMLLSFPFQGYGPVSICFSTLSILASYYLAFVIWKAKAELTNNISLRFLIAGLFYLVISSIGPFATVPLIITGKAGTALYFNAIYFYLHFQYNGWFSFLLLGVLYKIIGEKRTTKGNIVFVVLNIACIPSYFLSTLWSHPSFIFYLLSGIATLLQIVGLFYLWQDLINVKKSGQRMHPLIYLALLTFSIKLILQLAGSLPVIAEMAYQHKNFIIAFLHMVLLGFVTLFIFGAMAGKIKPTVINRIATAVFVLAWICSEVILIVQAFGEQFLFLFPGYNKWILVVSSLFPIAVFFLWFDTLEKKEQR